MFRKLGMPRLGRPLKAAVRQASACHDTRGRYVPITRAHIHVHTGRRSRARCITHASDARTHALTRHRHAPELCARARRGARRLLACHGAPRQRAPPRCAASSRPSTSSRVACSAAARPPSVRTRCAAPRRRYAARWRVASASAARSSSDTRRSSTRSQAVRRLAASAASSCAALRAFHSFMSIANFAFASR